MSTVLPPYFSWKEGFELGIPRFDTGHRNLLGVLRELHFAATRGDAGAQARIHERLIQAATLHFHLEEEYLAAFGYPGLRDLRDDHAQLTGIIGGLRLTSGDAPREVVALARDLMIRHILGTDKVYAEWLIRTSHAVKQS